MTKELTLVLGMVLGIIITLIGVWIILTLKRSKIKKWSGTTKVLGVNVFVQKVKEGINFFEVFDIVSGKISFVLLKLTKTHVKILIPLEYERNEYILLKLPLNDFWQLWERQEKESGKRMHRRIYQMREQLENSRSTTIIKKNISLDVGKTLI